MCSFVSMLFLSFFFFNDTATTEIYTLSLHDALPILNPRPWRQGRGGAPVVLSDGVAAPSTTFAHAAFASARHYLVWRSVRTRDRKSTRLNSSHANISYAVFCLKKKKKK